MGNIKIGISNTSSNLVKTSDLYSEYEGELKKADLYVKGLKKKEEDNERRIKMAFWFLVGVVLFIFVRRTLFPSFYRGWFS